MFLAGEMVRQGKRFSYGRHKIIGIEALRSLPHSHHPKRVQMARVVNHLQDKRCIPVVPIRRLATARLSFLGRSRCSPAQSFKTIHFTRDP